MKCQNCDGCGRVASGEEGASWATWMELPIQSALAVTSGTVKPMQCPECLGTGYVALKLMAELVEGMGFVYNPALHRFEPKHQVMRPVTPAVLETVVRQILRQYEDGKKVEQQLDGGHNGN